MRAQLKPLSRQTIVLTGASSGHGLAAAQRAAATGARVLLVARNAEALDRIVTDIRGKGGTAEFFAADVGREEEVDAAADFAVATFGGFDTWVNNAGTGIYAEALETPTADHRRLFDTNYFGVVHGSLAAVRHLREKPEGGALINVGSIQSDMPAPVLSSYTASKHAVKGFTDSLRIELIAAGSPVSVTLIKPSAIATPFPQHGRNLTGYKARLPEPLYAPELVAHAILDAAQHPRRGVTVGGAGKLQVLGANLAPGLFDRLASSMGDALVDKSQPVPVQEGSLYVPQPQEARVAGEQSGRGVSAFTLARTSPLTTIAAIGMVTIAAGLGALRPK